MAIFGLAAIGSGLPAPASAQGQGGDAPHGGWAPTRRQGRGPYYKKGAPFRGLLAPAGAPGQPILIQGRVWSLDTKSPLADAIVEVWQTDREGRYHGTRNPGNFDYRARMQTGPNGRYRFETIRPAGYGSGFFTRPAHIHFLVRREGYKTLATQLYFQGDPRLASDTIAHPSLAIALKRVKMIGKTYEMGRFDIVLERK